MAVQNWQETEEKSNPWPKRRLAFRTAIQHLDSRSFADIVAKYGVHHSIEALSWDSAGGPEAERLIELCVWLADDLRGKNLLINELEARNKKLDEQLRAKIGNSNSGDDIPF